MKLSVSSLCAILFICVVAFQAIDGHPQSQGITTHTPPTSQKPPFEECGMCPTIVEKIRKKIKDNPTEQRVLKIFELNCGPLRQQRDIIPAFNCKKYRLKIKEAAPKIADLNLPSTKPCWTLGDCMCNYPRSYYPPPTNKESDEC